MTRVIRVVLLGVGLAVGSTAPAIGQAAEPLPSQLALMPGEMRDLVVDGLERVAIGNPDVADVLVVSDAQLLVKAKEVGSTSLIVWDRRGQTTVQLTVEDPLPTQIALELRRLLDQLGLAGVHVKQEGSRVFLSGEVESQQDLDRIEQLLTAYKEQVTSVVTVAPAPPQPPAPIVHPPLVKLMVQVIELSRRDLEKLGVRWSESIVLTEPEATDRTFSDALFRWGTSLTRGSLSATLNALVEQNRARVLAEPKLVTTSGKEASSFIGVDVPVIEATAFGVAGGAAQASIKFRQTGVLLKMTPVVLADQQISTMIEAELSGIDKASGLNVPVGAQTVLVPGFTVRKASTEVTTASGETIVIAGLLEAEDSNTLSQVPAVGSIPVFGRLFRSPEVKSSQREIVIAMTPQLLAEAESTTDRLMALEQALVTAEVTASIEDPKLRYALQVQERIAKALRYPTREQELGLGGTVKLRLHLFGDGTLGRSLVAQSSGIEALDLAALKAAETQAPYPPFPTEFAGRDLWLEVPIIFRPN